MKALSRQIYTDIGKDIKGIDLIRDDKWDQYYTAWRRHPYFSPWHKFRLSLPGFGTALVAFTIYVILDKLGVFPHRDDHHH